MSTTTEDMTIPSDVTDGETHSTVVPPAPEIDVTEVPLEGQPATDKAFRSADGLTFRARVVTIARQATQAPANGAPTIAPSGINLSLTLALLDENMEVAKDANGALLITDLHEIVWTDAAMRNEQFDPAAHLMSEVRQQAYILKTRMEKRTAVSDVLAGWGGAPMKQIAQEVAPEVHPLSPATSSVTVQEIIDEAAKTQAALIVDGAVADARADERAKIEAEQAAEPAPAEDEPTTTS